MKGSIGCPTTIISHFPYIPTGICEKELSKEAKHRLKIIDWYNNVSGKQSKTGKPNAALTCRHFGINRSYFYYWRKRYDKNNLCSLENQSTAPNNKRQPSYSPELVSKITKIRKENPTYSGKKIHAILEREGIETPSIATIGRIITRKNLFFRADVNRHKKKSKKMMKVNARKRKPYELKADAPCKVIEFDMKHIYLLGVKLYAMCAIDTYTREAIIHVASRPSSRVAKEALQEVICRFGKSINIVCDNGSENMKEAEQYLKDEGITQYWCAPHKPKEKPMIERFIGTFQKECLDYNYTPLNVAEAQGIANTFLEKYHFYRPHESLNMLTPAQYCEKVNHVIPHRV